MPVRPLGMCSHPGCKALTKSGQCARHLSQARAAHDAQRGSAHERGYGSRWRKARAGYLRAHPLCRRCEADGRVTAATVVDHITPHRGDMALFWAPDNWQPLCKRHHDEKTGRGA